MTPHTRLFPHFDPKQRPGCGSWATSSKGKHPYGLNACWEVVVNGHVDRLIAWNVIQGLSLSADPNLHTANLISQRVRLHAGVCFDCGAIMIITPDWQPRCTRLARDSLNIGAFIEAGCRALCGESA